MKLFSRSTTNFEPKARVELLQKLIDRNSRWTEVADAKAGVVIVFTTTAVRYLIDDPLQSLGTIVTRLPHDLSPITVAFSVAMGAGVICGAIGAAIALIRSFTTLSPAMSRKQEPGRLFFGDVASYQLRDYQQHIATLETDSLERQLTEQVHTTATISTRKHDHVRQAMRGLAFMIASGLVAYVLNLQMK